MDFKVAGAAGARSGITAFQMDIKVRGSLCVFVWVKETEEGSR
jgi:polyribonucleotide nucleotidyltransferase